MHLNLRRASLAVLAAALIPSGGHVHGQAGQAAVPASDSACVTAHRAVALGIEPDSAPRPTAVVLPPLPAPAAVRGRTYAVAIWVDADGEPAADSIRTTPDLQPSAYRRRLEQTAARMRFRPARLAGCAVPGWYAWNVRLE